MPILQRFDQTRVLLYFGDHPLPHVHGRLRDGRECTVDLDSLEIKGRVEAREIREPLAWITARRDLLHEEWRRCNP